MALTNLTIGVSNITISTYEFWNSTNTSTSAIVNQTAQNTTIAVEQLSDLQKFSRLYENIHGYLGAGVSIFGLIANLLNIIVLTRKHMISPTNYLLIGLAVADMLKMVSYLPYSMYMYILTSPLPSYGHSRNGIVFVVIHNSFVVTCHTIAMWITVSLAVFRYIVVCHHTHGPRLCNLYRAKVTILAITVVSILFCIPQYVMTEVSEMEPGHYWMVFRNITNIEILQTMSFWTYGVVIKIAPCILLTLLSALLIHAMYKANKKREKLKSQGKRAEFERTSEHNRTTAMLVAVVLCFVITEAPQGILVLLSGIYTEKEFFDRIYTPLGDIMDILVLINSAVNFLLYCIMSRQFRETFSNIFLKPCRGKVFSAQQNGMQYSTIETKTNESTRV